MRTALATALALASSSAAALGLGQIELKSRLGEPLLAEIPIISNDPAELERLQAGLASPETFARIGLRPPDSVVANLQFVSALDARGNPVIRVTSTQPIEQPLLTFLVEVDWGQGKLVREYSALLDTPRTVSAPMQPPIQAPVVEPSNAIVREPESTPVPMDEIGGQADADAVAANPQPEPIPEGAIDPAPVSTSPPAPVATAPPPAPAGRPAEYGAVQAGETLSEIAERLDFGASLDQAMIALLNANPEAFIGGNINLLKQGAVLRVPEAADVRSIELADAMAQVRKQTRAWRIASAPVPQPALADAATEAFPAGDASAAPVPAAGGARLEIVPPGASGATAAGTQSGISAGAEGDMVRQEIQQARETLAARNAELADLKSRVEELEKLQSDQQKLLEMKDNELTAVQQRLARNQDVEEAARNPGLPWVFGGVGLLLLGLLGGWWMRRRAEVSPKFRVPPQAAAPSPLAAGFPGGQGAAVSRPAEPDTVSAPGARAAATTQASTADAASAEARVAGKSGDVGGPRDFWGRSERPPLPGKRPPAPTAVPTWHAGSDSNTVDMPTLASVEPILGDSDAPGSERLELARAYLDLGDRDSARQLLGEVALNGDHSARQQATQMLRELD